MKNKKNNTMINVSIFVLVAFLIIPSFGIAYQGIQTEDAVTFLKPQIEASRADQHTVLGEVASATWCGYCPSMAYWIGQVSGDFVYVSLVTDMSAVAGSRSSQLGTTGYPTAFFDGGYRSVVGGQSSSTQLQNAYNTCQSRSVADVFPSVSAVYDEDDNSMDITVFVDNQESTRFDGHLRVYVVEKTSRWLDYDGDPYTNALIGFPINSPISISSGQTYTATSQGWSFPFIEKDNIMIIASVFDEVTGYAEQTAVAYPSSGGGGGGDYAPPPVVTITSPDEGAIVNDTITIEGTAHHPLGDGRLKWVFLKIDDGSWEQVNGIVDWTYEWDTTSVYDGEYLIQAVSSDGSTQSGVDVLSVTVKNNESDDPDTLLSDLKCTGSLQWSDVEPGETVEAEFFVSNEGDIGSILNWEVESYPSWGEWYVTPNSGSGLLVEDGSVEISVLVTAPDEEEQEFSGSLTLVNLDDESDTEQVSIHLVTQYEPQSWMQMLWERLLDFFPFLSLIN